MKWIELSAASDAGCVERVAEIFNKYGRGGTVIEDWTAIGREPPFTVKIYLPHSNNIGVTVEHAQMDLRQIRADCPLQLDKRLLDRDDWVDILKKQFGVMNIGERLIVQPSWHKQERQPPGKIVIELDPGMAFGTGHHQTTRMCLLRLEKHVGPRIAVLDLGTGSGILAIAAARLGAGSVLALDNDPVAFRVARANIKSNGVCSTVEVKKGTVSTRTRKNLQGKFDLLVANLTSRAISDLAGEMAYVLKPAGRLVVSGIIPSGLDEVLISLAMADLKIEAIDTDGDWHAVVATKPE